MKGTNSNLHAYWKRERKLLRGFEPRNEGCLVKE